MENTETIFIQGEILESNPGSLMRPSFHTKKGDYYFQGYLCNPLTPAETSNVKFLLPDSSVYYQPYSTYIYPAQDYRFIDPRWRVLPARW